MNDDVNDAMWILIHAIDDMCSKHVELSPKPTKTFTPNERRRIYADAKLLCQVFERHEVGADV